MNRKKFIIKFLILATIISGAFVLSSCFSTTMGLMACRNSCIQSCNNCNSDRISGNECGIYYTLSEDGESYFVSEVGYKEAFVVIPDTYEGKPVTGISRGAFTHYVSGVGCSGSYYIGSELTSLTLPDTIKVIESGVFGSGYSYGHYGNSGAKCNTLIYLGTTEEWCNIDFGCMPFDSETRFYLGDELVTSVEIPESITKIKEYTFANYSYLKSVTFHENISIIEEYSFYGCKGLEELNFPCKDLTVCAYAFENCSGVKEINFTGEKLVLENEVFALNSELEEVNWNSVNITVIPQNAFEGCIKLETVVIPSTVEVIRDGAFAECYNLVEVYNFSSLDIVAGSSSNGGVAYYAGLVHTTEEDDDYILTAGDYKILISEAGNSLFKYTGEGGALNLPVLEGGATYEISRQTFYNNNTILSVNIPDCVTAIGERAFENCDNLKIVSGCAGVVNIGYRAFANCRMIESVALVKVETISDYAFSRCGALNAVALPQSVKKIGACAFDGTAAITYAGTYEEWLEVELSKVSEENIKVTCSDGEIWEGKI